MNKMLKSVLEKLVECANKHNHCVKQNMPEVANHHTRSCQLLLECLADAGYFSAVSFARHQGPEFMCLYTCINFDVPYILAPEIKAFETVGFEWIKEQSKMIYKFEDNRKETENGIR